MQGLERCPQPPACCTCNAVVWEDKGTGASKRSRGWLCWHNAAMRGVWSVRGLWSPLPPRVSTSLLSTTHNTYATARGESTAANRSTKMSRRPSPSTSAILRADGEDRVGPDQDVDASSTGPADTKEPNHTDTGQGHKAKHTNKRTRTSSLITPPTCTHTRCTRRATQQHTATHSYTHIQIHTLSHSHTRTHTRRRASHLQGSGSSGA